MTTELGDVHQSSGNFGFLAGGGETAGIIATYPWQKTPLGPICDWPHYLRNTCSLILRSPVPMVTLWGEEGIMIYNDAYSEFAGGRHPELFGSPVRKGWPEVADFNDHVMRTCLAGRTLAFRDQELTLYRHRGQPEQVWMNLDYSPLVDDEGRPVAVIAIVVETTSKVRAERRLASEGDRLRQMFEQAPGFVATMSGPDHVFEIANRACRVLLDDRDIIGKPFRQALPELVGQGFLDLLDGVWRAGTPYVGRSVQIMIERRDSRDDERFLDFICQPIFNEAGTTSGVFVQGYDVTEQRLAEDALRDSENRFRLVAEDAPVMLWMTNARGRIVYLNSELRRFWGLPDQDHGDFDWLSAVHPEDRVWLGDYMASRNIRSEPDLVEIRLRSSVGLYRLVQCRFLPRFDSTGAFIGMIGVNVDVTEVRAQEKRRTTDRPVSPARRVERHRICCGRGSRQYHERQPRGLRHDRSGGGDHRDREGLECAGYRDPCRHAALSRFRNLYRRPQAR